MHCRNCNNEVKEKAIACLSCGQDPKLGDKFCYDCGGETNEKQVICLKCGISLKGKNNIANDDGFYRSSDDKIIIGLCGGLAHKFGTNPLIIRILALVIPGWPLYFFGLLLPKKSTKSI